MSNGVITCPRCFFTMPIQAELRFCPRCGLPDVFDAASDTSPLDITADGRTFTVLDRIAIGSVSSIYRCRLAGASSERIFKIAREARGNEFLANEAEVLRRLHSARSDQQIAAFTPAVEASLMIGDAGDAIQRRANILRMHEQIRSPDELYTLAEVKTHYPNGLDPRDMAWIWRRLLTVLACIHSADIVHAAVLPMHVLIEPREHKLVLIDWCCAVCGASNARRPFTMLAGGHSDWYKREGAMHKPPTTALDIAFSARCMIELMGGDPVRPEFPPGFEPAIGRYFGRILGTSPEKRPDALALLEQFDRVIEALWGPRRFRPLQLPPKSKSSA